MDSLRRVPRKLIAAGRPCCRCGEEAQHWDRLCGRPYCPNCEEELVLGEAAPLRLGTERRRCVVCERGGTVRYLTFPLGKGEPVEMDVCGAHLRRLLGRCLAPRDFQTLRRRLRSLGLSVDQVFLLHDAFYDRKGRALQPALGLE